MALNASLTGMFPIYIYALYVLFNFFSTAVGYVSNISNTRLLMGISPIVVSPFLSFTYFFLIEI